MAFKMKGSAFKQGNVATKSALEMKSPLEQDNAGIVSELRKEGMVKGADDVWRDPLDVYNSQHGKKTRQDFGPYEDWEAHMKKMTEYAQSKLTDEQRAKMPK